MIQTLDNGDLTKAYEIVPVIKRAKAEFEKESALLNRFECLRNGEKYFENKLEELQDQVNQGLENIFMDWDEQKLESYLKFCYMSQTFYSSDTSLITRIPEIIKHSIKLTIKQVIELYVQNKTFAVRIFSSINNFYNLAIFNKRRTQSQRSN